MYQTQMYEGMLAETVTMGGDSDTLINAYLARQLGAGPFPAMILLHHMPGWDEWYREATRRFAHHGYVTLCPNLYYRIGHGTPEDVAVKVRADGGIPDDMTIPQTSLVPSWASLGMMTPAPARNRSTFTSKL